MNSTVKNNIHKLTVNSLKNIIIPSSAWTFRILPRGVSFCASGVAAAQKARKSRELARWGCRLANSTSKATYMTCECRRCWLYISVCLGHRFLVRFLQSLLRAEYVGQRLVLKRQPILILEGMPLSPFFFLIFNRSMGSLAPSPCH